MRRATSHVRRATCDVLRAVLLACLAAFAACGESPSQPGPIVQQPPPTPIVSNIAPVIESVTASASRVEADTDVTITATVRDAETPIDQLTFDWKADAGTFTGTGASVRWRAPRNTQTPANYAINLTVTERYGIPTASGPQPQHVVSAATPPQVRVHDSPQEIGDMALRFLRSFANSSVTSDAALQEFSDSCGGKKAEKEDIDDNRRDFEILSSQLALSSSRVTSAFSRGEVTVRCSFSSRRKFCPADAPRGCRVGAIENVDGTCRLTSVYEQQRWFLCDSNFFGSLAPTMKGFFGRDR